MSQGHPHNPGDTPTIPGRPPQSQGSLPSHALILTRTALLAPRRAELCRLQLRGDSHRVRGVTPKPRAGWGGPRQWGWGAAESHLPG